MLEKKQGKRKGIRLENQNILKVSSDQFVEINDIEDQIGETGKYLLEVVE